MELQKARSYYQVGQAMFLIGLVELAFYSFVKGDVAMTRPPMGELLEHLNPGMAYLSGILIILCVFAFFLERYQTAAILTLAVLVFLLTTMRHIYLLWQDHINGLKTLWFIAGALLILTTLHGYKQYQQRMVWLGSIILALFFVDCGIAHFRFAFFIKELIPAYFPYRLFFTYFAGVCLTAACIGFLLPRFRAWAALLSGIQITLWFFTLHIPRAFSIGGDDWIGVGESLSVAGFCFMIFGIVKTRESGQTI